MNKKGVKEMLKFLKMEGIGNDYVYFDGINQDVPTDETFIQKVSNRHIGIGSDGVIIILPSETCDFRMRMFNLDGSEGKMCGNGIRCFSKFVYDQGLTDKTTLKIETLAGIRTCELNVEDGKVVSVCVDMGEPITLCSDIPVNYSKVEMVNAPIEIDGNTYYCTAVSMGNPHVIQYVDTLDFDIEATGPKFEHASLFPESVNTEFVKVVDREHLKMRVWERGSGETMACGTGACAVMYASYLNNKCDEKVDVELLGGHLQIELRDKKIFMTGPARTTFEGTLKEEEYA